MEFVLRNKFLSLSTCQYTLIPFCKHNNNFPGDSSHKETQKTIIVVEKETVLNSVSMEIMQWIYNIFQYYLTLLLEYILGLFTNVESN